MSMRVKDTGDISTDTTMIHTGSSIPPGSPVVTTFNRTLSRRGMIGSEIPHFYSKLKRGDLLPHTAFTQYEVEHTFNGGHYEAHKVAPGTAWSNISNWNGFSVPICPVFSTFNEQYEAYSKLYDGADKSVLSYYTQKAASKIYSQGWDALTFAAELPKLVRSLSTIVKDLKRLHEKGTTKLLSLKEKDRLLKDTFEQWLKSRYEWRILLYDIQDISHALTEIDRKRKIFSERQGTTQSGSRTTSKTVSGTDFVLDTSVTAEWEHSLRGAVSGVIIPPRIQTNPVISAWELIKWSFIIDWVFDVGTALEALSFAMISSKYVASHGTQTKVSFQETVTATLQPGIIGSAGYSYSGSYTTQVRTPTSVTFVPQLTGRSLTGEMLLDLTALARLRLFKR